MTRVLLETLNTTSTNTTTTTNTTSTNTTTTTTTTTTPHYFLFAWEVLLRHNPLGPSLYMEVSLYTAFHAAVETYHQKSPKRYK